MGTKQKSSARSRICFARRNILLAEKMIEQGEALKELEVVNGTRIFFGTHEDSWSETRGERLLRSAPERLRIGKGNLERGLTQVEDADTKITWANIILDAEKIVANMSEENIINLAQLGDEILT